MLILQKAKSYRLCPQKSINFAHKKAIKNAKLFVRDSQLFCKVKKLSLHKQVMHSKNRFSSFRHVIFAQKTHFSHLYICPNPHYLDWQISEIQATGKKSILRCESLTKRWTQKTALGREQKSVKTLTRILLNSSQLEIENRKPMLRYYVGMGNKNNV